MRIVLFLGAVVGVAFVGCGGGETAGAGGSAGSGGTAGSGGAGGSGLVDECATGADDCDTNATCTDTASGFDCACNTGWEGTGKVCTDKDECTLGTDNCTSPTTCSNTDGGFECAIYITVSGNLDIDAVTAGVISRGGSAVSWGAAGDTKFVLWDVFTYFTSGFDFDAATLAVNNDLSACTPGTPCPLTFTNVNIAGMTNWILGSLIDNRGTPQFHHTYTPVVPPPVVAALLVDPTPGFQNGLFWGASVAALDAVSAAAGVNSTDALANTSMFLSVLGPTLSPVAGVTVQDLGSQFTVHYPLDDLSGTGSSTDTGGLFFAMGNSSTAGNPLFRATYSGGPNTWGDLPAGRVAGAVVVAGWPSAPACAIYCNQALAACAVGGTNEIYADDAACQTACGGLAATGTTDDTTGDTVQCRIYHLRAAESDAATYCPHGQAVSSTTIGGSANGPCN